jgi:hypothetical protein
MRRSYMRTLTHLAYRTWLLSSYIAFVLQKQNSQTSRLLSKHSIQVRGHVPPVTGRLLLKCDGTRAEIRFRLSAKWTSLFKSAGGVSSVDYWAAEVCASAVVMLDTPLFRGSVKSTGYPLHSPVSPSLPLPESPCAITFQLDSNSVNSNSNTQSTKTVTDNANCIPCPFIQWYLQPMSSYLKFSHANRRTIVIVIQMQKSVILGICSIVRNFLNYK